VTYLVIPVDSPARLVDEHVHGQMSVVSDALGGAFSVGMLIPGQPVAAHVREDCVTAGLARNRLASMLYSYEAAERMPILGPAVFTMVIEVTGGQPGLSLGIPYCLPSSWAARLKLVADDMWLALNGREHLIEVGPNARITPGEYAVAVRVLDDRIGRMPLPANYPYPPTVPRDPLAEKLARVGLHVNRQNPDDGLI
jgi:hypothetical protein